MKIALIAPPWNAIPPPKYGGSEAMVDGLARAIVRAGHDVELVALEGSTCPVPTRTIAWPSQPRAFSPVCHETAYVLKAYEGVERFDVVHDMTIVGPIRAQAIKGLAFLTTNHGPFEGVLNSIYETISPWTTIIGISHAQASTAPVPVEVIHHGVDPDQFTFGSGGGDKHGKYLLFLGRMHDTKGPHIAAEVAHRTGQRLLIAAKMHEEAEIAYYRKMVEPLLSDKIEYIGEVGGREKTELLGDATALVNPITWPEPFGLVMAEALACGTPVIAFRQGAAAEIVNHGVTGFLCDDLDEMETACRNVGQLDRRAARAAVDNYFNIDRMAADHIRLYEQLVAQQAAGRAGMNDAVPDLALIPEMELDSML